MFRFLWLLPASVILFSAGCGPAAPLVVPVSGKVTFKGAPCNGALVVFHPQDKDKVNGPKPAGTTSEDGIFKLTTHTPDDGAEPGQYSVTVVWNAPAKEGKLSISGEGGGGADRLKGRYGNPAQPKLSASVQSSQENSFQFELH